MPETELESKAEPKIIVDIGAGLSNFSLETNKRFKDSGTVAVAVDPVYQSLGTDFKKFEENVGRANMETLSLDNPEDAYREIKDAPNKVAGSHQELPFGDESVDLVLANHAITQYDDKEITRQALQEARRVVKEHGEIRISPANIGLDKRENAPSYYYIGDVKYIDSKKSQNTEVVEEAEKLGLPLPPDRELFKIFKELEDTGLNFYVVKYGPKSNTRMARFARNSSPWTIILRKDDQLPNVEIGSDRGVFFKLAFGKSSDGFHVPWIGVSEEEE
ncbi:MAG: methyltransferase domain-containing protein [Candidatus Staskawiczbacteria bacterium]|nr:methyltransferase domain-containing protein [Candidatus Staskawiczbacteria bacterium]